LIARLAKISALRVISRTSVMLYKNADKPLKQIAGELRVDGVLEGSVLASGGHIRLTADLIDVRSERSLWAETYERSISDIVSLQSELARAVAGEIRARITPDEAKRLASVRPVDPQAYRTYLKGRSLISRWSDFSAENIGNAVTAFKEVVQSEPGFAPAWASLAEAYMNQAVWMYVPAEPTMRAARDAADRAIALDDGFSLGHGMRAFVAAIYEWDWERARKEFERAIELEPSNVEAWLWQPCYLTALGKHDEAIAAARRAIDVAPMVIDWQIQLGWDLHYARRYDDSITQLKTVLDREPKNSGALMVLVWNYAAKHATSELRATRDKFLALAPPGEPIVESSVFVALPPEEQLKLVALWEERARTGFADAYVIATMHAALNNIDQAFAWLDTAFNQRSVNIYTMNIDPMIDPLRKDSRFPHYVERLRLP
jgi:tetratricopeptide (TPR) repeat protein